MNKFLEIFKNEDGKMSSNRVFAGGALMVGCFIAIWQVIHESEVDHTLIFEFLTYAFGAKALSKFGIKQSN